MLELFHVSTLEYRSLILYVSGSYSLFSDAPPPPVVARNMERENFTKFFWKGEGILGDEKGIDLLTLWSFFLKLAFVSVLAVRGKASGPRLLAERRWPIPGPGTYSFTGG